MPSDNNSLWGKVLFGISFFGAGVFLSSLAGNNSPVQNKKFNDCSEVRVLHQKLAQKDEKIKVLERKVRDRINDLLETERKWVLQNLESPE
jgi:hypothetical protein